VLRDMPLKDQCREQNRMVGAGVLARRAANRAESSCTNMSARSDQCSSANACKDEAITWSSESGISHRKISLHILGYPIIKDILVYPWISHYSVQICQVGYDRISCDGYTDGYHLGYIHLDG
jgi:hypothetical protein